MIHQIKQIPTMINISYPVSWFLNKVMTSICHGLFPAELAVFLYAFHNDFVIPSTELRLLERILLNHFSRGDSKLNIFLLAPKTFGQRSHSTTDITLQTNIDIKPFCQHQRHCIHITQSTVCYFSSDVRYWTQFNFQSCRVFLSIVFNEGSQHIEPYFESSGLRYAVFKSSVLSVRYLG